MPLLENRGREFVTPIIIQVVIIVLALLVLGFFAWDDRRNRAIRRSEKEKDKSVSSHRDEG